MDQISDALSRFIESPSYLQPLLEFIDQHCPAFDVKEGNKLEYKIHENFKQLVEGLICDYLASLDVPLHEFIQYLSRHINEEAYDTLVNSILVVDDYILFKDMMIKRKSQLEEDENELYEPMDMERLQGPSITHQSNDLDAVIGQCYKTWNQQKDEDAANILTDPFMKVDTREKVDSRNEERAVETQRIKTSASYCRPQQAEEFTITCKKNGSETSSAAEKPQKASKADSKQLLEESEHSNQGFPLDKRRDEPRDVMVPPKKGYGEKEKTDDPEYRRNNPYLQQYLKREALAKSAVIQEDKAVKRRGTRMWELALELQNELTWEELPAGKDSFVSKN